MRTGTEVIEVAIEKLVAGGLGLARHDGLTVLVPLAAPGDRLAVRLVERRRSWARAEIVEILAPGPGRRAPPCPHYAHCGGCDLQHLDEEGQLAAKVQAAVETLARLGGVHLERPPIVLPGSPWGYRRRAQLRVVEAPGTDRARLGLLARGSHDVVALESCPILVPALDAALRELPSQLPAGSARLELAAGDGGAWTARLDGAPWAVGPAAGGPVGVRVGPFAYRFDASSFFQAHAQMLESLVAAVLGPDDSAPGAGELAGDAADLYAGVGLFTLPLAQRHARVHAVESEPAAAEFLAGNAERNRVRNVTVETASVEQAVARLPGGWARIVVDPPRTGLSPPVRRALLALAPRRLTYVSCDVATLARDLKIMAAGFALESLTLLDLFPQTSHLEAVAQLRPAAGPTPPGSVALG